MPSSAAVHEDRHGLGACAEIVRRFDPDLFRAALFAREPARGRLMVLAAFDIELSRATAKAAASAEGPMLAAMRLQFWRDRLQDAVEAKAPPAHEVAAPLHTLLSGPMAGKIAESAMLIEARGLELHPPMDEAVFARWVEMRFGAWHRLALAALGLADGVAGAAAARLAGEAAGRAFVIRNAVAMAGQGRTLLPGIDQATESLLARGDVTPTLAATIKRLAAEGLASLSELRGLRSSLRRAAAPAFLPLWRAERDLLAAKGGLPGGGRPLPQAAGEEARVARALAYLWRASTGRW
ncbi:MAG: squalene/phytoene synthase family protein [Pseudomonadota bacterium]